MRSVPAVLCRAGPQVLSLERHVAVANPVSQMFLRWWEPHEMWGPPSALSHVFRVRWVLQACFLEQGGFPAPSPWEEPSAWL